MNNFQRKHLLAKLPNNQFQIKKSDGPNQLQLFTFTTKTSYIQTPTYIYFLLKTKSCITCGRMRETKLEPNKPV